MKGYMLYFKNIRSFSMRIKHKQHDFQLKHEGKMLWFFSKSSLSSINKAGLNVTNMKITTYPLTSCHSILVKCQTSGPNLMRASEFLVCGVSGVPKS